MNIFFHILNYLTNFGHGLFDILSFFWRGPGFDSQSVQPYIFYFSIHCSELHAFHLHVVKIYTYCQRWTLQDVFLQESCKFVIESGKICSPRPEFNARICAAMIELIYDVTYQWFLYFSLFARKTTIGKTLVPLV